MVGRWGCFTITIGALKSQMMTFVNDDNFSKYVFIINNCIQTNMYLLNYLFFKYTIKNENNLSKYFLILFNSISI